MICAKDHVCEAMLHAYIVVQIGLVICTLLEEKDQRTACKVFDMHCHMSSNNHLQTCSTQNSTAISRFSMGKPLSNVMQEHASTVIRYAMIERTTKRNCLLTVA